MGFDMRLLFFATILIGVSISASYSQRSHVNLLSKKAKPTPISTRPIPSIYLETITLYDDIQTSESVVLFSIDYDKSGVPVIVERLQNKHKMIKVQVGTRQKLKDNYYLDYRTGEIKEKSPIQTPTPTPNTN